MPKGKTGVQVGFPVGVEPGIIERATFNEFGTTRIPERPFLRNAMKANRRKYEREMKSAAKLILAGQMTTEQALTRLGIMAQGDIQDEISTFSDPPNAASTIAQKGSSKPLIDTGQMRQAVTYRIVK
jgi:hypothetical protein